MAKDKDVVVDMEFDGEKFQQVDKYADKYSEKGFWSKIKKNVKAVGVALIYKALQLFYVTENPNCPTKVKAAIFAALGYFISPIDFIPDFTPVLGYSDDAGAIAVALTMAQFYIDETVKQKAKDKLCKLFGEEILSQL